MPIGLLHKAVLQLSERIYSAVLDPRGEYLLQAYYLIWSLTKIAGVKNHQIILHVIDTGIDDQLIQFLESLAIEYVFIEPYPNHPYCNKLSQLKSLAGREFSDVVLLDCDVLVLEEPPTANRKIFAKVVDFCNPPLDLLKTIFNKANIDYRLSTSDVDGLPTIFGNCNGGVYIIDSILFEDLSRAWLRWANWCMLNANIFGVRWKNIDQVSFAMAVSSENFPFEELDRRFNVPTHVQQDLLLDCFPAILHYHRALDSQKFLLPVNNLPSVNKAIEKMNRLLWEDRRSNFSNYAFWNARYSLDPHLGSGLGSKDTSLEIKQIILVKVITDFEVKTVLDIGGGDGSVVSILKDFKLAIKGIDISKESMSLYLNSIPSAKWELHDISALPYSHSADLVICFDLLIHMPSIDMYESVIENILQNNSLSLISAYEKAPSFFGPMTYFYSPISSAFKKYQRDFELLGEYRDTAIFLVYPEKVKWHT